MQLVLGEAACLRSGLLLLAGVSSRKTPKQYPDLRSTACVVPVPPQGVSQASLHLPPFCCTSLAASH